MVEPEAHTSPPPVVAVLVTHDAPEHRFDQVLRSLACQDYPNLDVLVVDTGTVDPTERVRAVLPAAVVRRVEGNPGFGAAANTVLEVVTGAEYHVFCHDDAAPDAGAVSAMVAAARQWGADVVGPKLVQWDEPRRFTQFGLAVDKVGVPLPYVLRGELDQGQYDGLRDVFAVPGAFTLVRASRFAEVGGFDEAISFLGDDLSLSWRARVAGARVVVAPAARVRHAEALTHRAPATGLVRLAARHRARVVLTSYAALSLVRVVPQALALALAEAAGALVTRRPGRARAALAAWPWNLWRLPSLLRARRHVASFRSVGDREVRRYQVQGLVGPRLTLMRLGSGAPGAEDDDAPPPRAAAVPVRGHMDVDPAAWSPAAVAVAVCLAAVVVFGSRHLLTRGVPVVGGIVPAGGSAHDLLDAWWGGWRSVGLGGERSTPTLAPVLGLLGTALFGHVALARTLLVVGLVPLGIVGAHRLALPSGSKRAQVAGAVAYAAVPLPYDALAAGRWSALAAYAAAPWMLARLARASGAPPFAPLGRKRCARPRSPDGVGDEWLRHRLWQHVAATGAVTALAGVLVPQAAGLLVLTGAGLVAGSLLAGTVRGTGRMAVATIGGAAVSTCLLLPTAVDVLGSPRGIETWLGTNSASDALTAPDLLALSPGPTALPGVALALLAAAAVPLLVGRGWRLAWAVRGWMVAVAAWGLAWSHQQGWMTLRLPGAGVLLAPAAAGLALAVAMGTAAITEDVRGRSWPLGVRRLVVAMGGLALVAATASAFVASLDGRWGMPGDDFAGLTGFVDDDVAGAGSRVLWVGEPELLPGGDGWDLDGRLSYTVPTGAATPGAADLWPATSGDASRCLGDALEVALAGETARLGELLAPMRVHYIAVPRRLAPSDDMPRDGGPRRRADELADALAGQLDLQHVEVHRGIVLYRNVAFVFALASDQAAAAPGGATAPGDRDGTRARALVAAQAASWLVVAVVTLRMRFGADEPAPTAGAEAGGAADGGPLAGAALAEPAAPRSGTIGDGGGRPVSPEMPSAAGSPASVPTGDAPVTAGRAPRSP